MGRQALVEQLQQDFLRPAAEMGAKAVGEQQRHAGGDIARDGRRRSKPLMADAYRRQVASRIPGGAVLLAPVIVGGVTCTYLL